MEHITKSFATERHFGSWTSIPKSLSDHMPAHFNVFFWPHIVHGTLNTAEFYNLPAASRMLIMETSPGVWNACKWLNQQAILIDTDEVRQLKDKLLDEYFHLTGVQLQNQ